MNVAIYTRVSTDDQIDNFSLSMQTDRCHAQALAKGWSVHKVYEDQAISGKDLDRPAYNQMLVDLHQGIIQGVIIFKLDRLSRDAGDIYQIIKTFQKNKWKLFSVSESLDISSPAGIMLIQVLASFSQFERSTIKQRMVDGWEQKRKQGGKIGGSESALFGYRKNEFNQIVIDEDEANVIRRIFHLRSIGLTLRAIADQLQKEKAKQRRSTSKGWSYVQVQKQLTYENVYKGLESFKGGGGFIFPAIL